MCVLAELETWPLYSRPTRSFQSRQGFRRAYDAFFGLETAAAMSLSVAPCLACGTDSNQSRPHLRMPKTRRCPSPSRLTQDLNAGPTADCGARRTAGCSPGPSGTVAIHSLAIVNPETGDARRKLRPASARSMCRSSVNPVPIDALATGLDLAHGKGPVAELLHTNISDATESLRRRKTWTFTVTHMDTHGGGRTIPDCVFDTTLDGPYQCGDAPAGATIHRPDGGQGPRSSMRVPVPFCRLRQGRGTGRFSGPNTYGTRRRRCS